jgi:hypothetical protein
MITYRGYDVVERAGRVYMETERRSLGRLVIGPFPAMVEAFRCIDQLVHDEAHPWLHDFRELVRLLNGQSELPHAVDITGNELAGCQYCAQARQLVSEVVNAAR